MFCRRRHAWHTYGTFFFWQHRFCGLCERLRKAFVTGDNFPIVLAFGTPGLWPSTNPPRRRCLLPPRHGDTQFIGDLLQAALVLWPQGNALDRPSALSVLLLTARQIVSLQPGEWR